MKSLLVLGLVVALAPAASGAPAEEGPARASPGTADPVPDPVQDDGRRTAHDLPANLLRGAIGVVSGKNLPAFIAVGTATAGASFLDKEAQAAATNRLDWSNAFETAGGPVYSSIFVAGMFTAGRLAHGERFRAMTYDMLDAAVVNASYTGVLKLAVGRERPNGSDNKSFPSGHTSNAFAIATVAERHYGWKVGVPSYLLAGLMGVSRIHEDKHWLSDVVGGAGLGYIVGRTVVRVNSRPLERVASGRATWAVSPIVGLHARGMQMSLTF